MLTLEIGARILAAWVIAALVVLVLQWWKYRSGRRG